MGATTVNTKSVYADGANIRTKEDYEVRYEDYEKGDTFSQQRQTHERRTSRDFRLEIEYEGSYCFSRVK